MDISKTKEQFALQVESMKLAGIYDFAMLNFGGLLGYARNRDGINYKDDDLDLGILPVPLENQNLYIWYLHGFRHKPSAAELLDLDRLSIDNPKCCFTYRREIRRNPITREMFWCSLRKFPAGESWKCCHWFWFSHGGFLWHHKGMNDGMQSLIKAIPENILEVGKEINYMGTTIHTPKKIGECLDYWYPDWATSRGGNSQTSALMDVADWADKKSWKINILY
jgi:hypothetical protein